MQISMAVMASGGDVESHVISVVVEVETMTTIYVVEYKNVRNEGSQAFLCCQCSSRSD